MKTNKFQSLISRMRSWAVVLITITTFSLILVPQTALAADSQDPIGSSQSKSAACSGLQLDASSNPCSNNTSGTTIGGIITDIINIMTVLIGVLAIIMIIVAGFKFVTSGGDSTKVASARNTLIYAIVGLVIAALAQVLIHFVLTRL